MSEILRLVNDLDRGFYRLVDGQRGDRGGSTAFGRLARLAEERGLAPEGRDADARETEFLRRFGVREPGSPFAERVRAFARQTWALDHALDELGIRTRGPEADALGKFFTSTASTVLFPTFVESQVVAGLLLSSLVPLAVAQEVFVNSHTAEHLALTESEEDRRTARSGEGARGPTVTIRTAERTVKLEKYQAQLNATYEALRLQRLNVVALFLQRLGAQLGVDETDDLISVAIDGDGNTGSAVQDTDAEVAGVLDYDELIRLSLAFPKGYEFRMAIANDAKIRAILNMDEFKDPQSGFTYQRTGRFPTPLGAEWHRWTSPAVASFQDRILALDTRLALVQYTEQGVITETDRLIDRQFEQTVVSKWVGFGKLDYEATQALNLQP